MTELVAIVGAVTALITSITALVVAFRARADLLTVAGRGVGGTSVTLPEGTTASLVVPPSSTTTSDGA